MLLLLHPALGAASQFDALLSHLPPKLNAQTMDLPGHGQLPVPNSEFSIQRIADHVLSFLENTDDGPLDIFGYSLGGYVGAMIAISHPHMVNRLMVWATKWEWNAAGAQSETSFLNPEVMQAKVPAYAQLLQNRHVDWKATVNANRELLLKLGESAPLNLEAMKSITQKARFAVGDQDTLVGIAETQRWQQATPNSSFLVVPNTKHPFEQLRTDRLAFELIQFFG